MKRTTAVALSSISLASTGCASLYKGYSVQELTVSKETNYVKLMDYLQGNDSGPLLPAGCLKVPVSDKDGDCAQRRNHTVMLLGGVSEWLCDQHRKSIYGNDAVWNVVSGTLTNVFAGAASVTSGASSKSLLSALALFSNSERSLVNETVYKQVLVVHVDDKIRQIREAKGNELKSKFGKSIAERHPSEAVHEVVAFHYSCSFMNGLQQALKEGIQDGPASKAARLRLALRALSAEMDAIPVAERSASREVQYQALAERYKSITDELKTLEKQ